MNGVENRDTQYTLGRVSALRRSLIMSTVNFQMFEEEINLTLINFNLPLLYDLLSSSTNQMEGMQHNILNQYTNINMNHTGGAVNHSSNFNCSERFNNNTNQHN